MLFILPATTIPEFAVYPELNITICPSVCASCHSVNHHPNLPWAFCKDNPITINHHAPSPFTEIKLSTGILPVLQTILAIYSMVRKVKIITSETTFNIKVAPSI